jgi:RNA polymerase-binding transcription factor DksA
MVAYAVGCDACAMKIHDEDSIRLARARLLARGAELRDRIGRVRADLRREPEPLPADFTEAAVRLENDEVLQAIETAATSELGHIGHALESIDAGTFGRCESCGKRIEAARLDIVPYAVRCLECETRG